MCFQSPSFSSLETPCFAFISPMPAHPMPMAFASTFLCSQEIHGLALMVDAYLLSGERRAKTTFSQRFTGTEASTAEATPTFTGGDTTAHGMRQDFAQSELMVRTPLRVWAFYTSGW